MTPVYGRRRPSWGTEAIRRSRGCGSRLNQVPYGPDMMLRTRRPADVVASYPSFEGPGRPDPMRPERSWIPRTCSFDRWAAVLSALHQFTPDVSRVAGQGARDLNLPDLVQVAG